MRGRSLMWWTTGLGFAITLAVVVGQRLSAEAMAVVIGVIAGVAASIPTSLIVVWFATRSNVTHTVMDMPVPRAAEPEPRVVVVAQPPPPAPAYQSYAGYPGQGLQPAGYTPAGYAPPAISPPRRFTVVGGAELAAEAEYAEEAIWER